MSVLGGVAFNVVQNAANGELPLAALAAAVRCASSAVLQPHACRTAHYCHRSMGDKVCCRQPTSNRQAQEVYAWRRGLPSWRGRLSSAGHDRQLKAGHVCAHAGRTTSTARSPPACASRTRTTGAAARCCPSTTCGGCARGRTPRWQRPCTCLCPQRTSCTQHHVHSLRRELRSRRLIVACTLWNTARASSKPSTHVTAYVPPHPCPGFIFVVLRAGLGRPPGRGQGVQRCGSPGRGRARDHQPGAHCPVLPIQGARRGRKLCCHRCGAARVAGKMRLVACWSSTYRSGLPGYIGRRMCCAMRRPDTAGGSCAGDRIWSPHVPVLARAGSGRAGRLHRGGAARLRRARAPPAQDAGRRHAPGRRARRAG